MYLVFLSAALPTGANGIDVETVQVSELQPVFVFPILSGIAGGRFDQNAANI